MKKLVSVITVILMMINIFAVSASAASKAPKPTMHTTYCDGYTKVSFDIPDGATVRYKGDGSKPSSSSPKYTGGSLKISKSMKLKLRVSKSGCTTAYYSYKINVKYTSFKTAINAQKLKPVTTGTDVDKYIRKAVNSCITDDMTTYEKVKACYNWFVKNVKYDSSAPVVLTLDYNMKGLSSFEDYLLVMDAEYAFENGSGVCDNFASTFLLMCRYIGVDAYRASGQVKKYGGGYTGHGWVVIKAGGDLYQFDPMLDASYAQRNKLDSSYTYFAREDGDSLYRNREIWEFNNFE